MFKFTFFVVLASVQVMCSVDPAKADVKASE